MLVTAVLIASAAWCGVAVVRADRRSPRHQAWRDPISWFASDEAPHAERLRGGLLAVAASLVALGLIGVARRRPPVAVITTLIAGGLIAGVAWAPLDCSVRLDYCEKFVDAGLASDAHRVHVALSAALVVLAVVSTVLAARRQRSAVSVAVVGVVLIASVAMFVVPTSEVLGTFQVVALAGGAWATVRLWRAAPTLVSPP